MFHVTWTTFKLKKDQLGTVSAYVMWLWLIALLMCTLNSIRSKGVFRDLPQFFCHSSKSFLANSLKLGDFSYNLMRKQVKLKVFQNWPPWSRDLRIISESLW